MNGKNTFIWAVVLGLAISGGISGVISLIFWLAALWAIGFAYDATAAFVRGWKSARTCNAESQKRPALRVIKGGLAG